MRRDVTAWVAIFWLAIPVALRAQEPIDVVTIHEGGDPARVIDLVILGDGYTIDEQDRFTSDAQQLLDFFFSLDILGNYRDFMNVHLVYLASNESGADHPNDGIYVDTALDATYGTTVPRLLTVNRTKAQTAAAYAPDMDEMLVIVNDSTYGGSGSTQLGVTYNGSAMTEVGVHEYGHSFAFLADEYGGNDCYGGSEPGEVNVTIATERETIPWALWIDPDTPLTQPDGEPGTPNGTPGVGIFVGGRYYDRCIYRPQESCEMRALYQGFCAVCKEQFVKRIYTFTDPIEGWTPETESVSVERTSGTVSFAVETREPVTKLSHQWYLDGEAIEGATDTTLLLDVSRLEPGTYTVSVQVWDPTELVRNDPSGLLSSEHAWTLEVTSVICGFSPRGVRSAPLFLLLCLLPLARLRRRRESHPWKPTS
ncbi:MAG: hypothetical protein D6795_08715 [Deltaproteobacteria bacterium]|nr:MAG: hypothetical protein D6795_08715 [Deltaproteobacteria bacterium]